MRKLLSITLLMCTVLIASAQKIDVQKVQTEIAKLNAQKTLLIEQQDKCENQKCCQELDKQLEPLRVKLRALYLQIQTEKTTKK
jgi:hypothetical protein